MTLLHSLVALFIVLSIPEAWTPLRNLKAGGY